MEYLPRLFVKLLLLGLGISYSILPRVAVAEVDGGLNLKSNTFMAVPMINNNPAMKWGFGGIAMYMFRLKQDDDISPPSLVSLAGLYSTNKSYILGLLSQLYFAEDKYRIAAGIGTSRINNDFEYDFGFITPVRLVYSEVRSFFGLQVSRAVAKHIYVGLQYSGVQTKYRFDRGTDEQNEFARALFDSLGITDDFKSSIGLPLSYDTRDYTYYPSNGMVLSVRPTIYAEWLGGDDNYTSLTYSLSAYKRIARDKVIAGKIAGGHSFGDVPFSGYQTYGTRATLRGYPAGKYRGKNMIGGQVEYRWQFYKRLGMVAFAGTGTVWGNEEEEEDFERSWLPSVGLGLRYMISTEKRVNFRADYAWGVNGNDGFYIGVMEAF